MISIPLKGFASDDDTSMSMPDLLETYLEQHEASPRYRESLRRTVKRLEAYGIGGVCQLAPDRVNKFLVAAAFRAVTVAPMPAGRGVASRADVPDGQSRDGPPELVIRGKHPVIAMPVLPRRRDKVRQTRLNGTGPRVPEAD